jgi:hypothetical protein
LGTRRFSGNTKFLAPDSCCQVPGQQIVWQTIEEVLPPLEAAIKKLIDEEKQEKMVQSEKK